MRRLDAPPEIDVRYEEQQQIRRAHNRHVWALLANVFWTFVLAMLAPLGFQTGNLVVISLGALGAALTLAIGVTVCLLTLDAYRAERRRFVARWGVQQLPD